MDSLEIRNFLIQENTTKEIVVDSLRSKGLAAMSNNRLHFLTKKCCTVRLPDGRIVAEDNHSGRLERWVMHFIEKFRAENQGENRDKQI